MRTFEERWREFLAATEKVDGTTDSDRLSFYAGAFTILTCQTQSLSGEVSEYMRKVEAALKREAAARN